MEDFLLFTLGSCWADMIWQREGDELGIQPLHVRTSHQANGSAAILNHDVERLVLEPVSSGQGDGIELCAGVPHKRRFQDVTALPVDLEHALV